MNERDLRLSLAVFLSIPFMFLLFPLLASIWQVIFPSSASFIAYAGRMDTPVHLVLPIASAIFFFLLFEYLDREGLLDPRNPLALLGAIALVFLAYYVGVGGFYFFRYTSLRLVDVMFTYFIYVPYWTVLAGLLSAWLLYALPLPKLFKEKRAQSSR